LKAQEYFIKKYYLTTLYLFLISPYIWKDQLGKH